MRWIVVRGLLAPLLLIGLAGCGGSPSSPQIASAEKAKNPSATSASHVPDDPLKFAQCMREHGVNMPDPDANGRVTIRAGKGEQTKVAAAQEACKKYMPGMGGKGSGPGVSKQDQAKFLRFAQCMRQHGVPMADPDFSGGGVEMRIKDPNGAPDQAKADAAQKTCQGLMPSAAQEGQQGPPHQESKPGG
jgi:hypothetical protein